MRFFLFLASGLQKNAITGTGKTASAKRHRNGAEMKQKFKGQS